MNRRINDNNPFDFGWTLKDKSHFSVNQQNTNYPPFNVFFDKETDLTFVEMAVAGFAKEDLSVSHDKKDNQLIVTGKGKNEDNPDGLQYTHKGISSKGFERKFNLHNHAVVKRVSLENGILSITMGVDIPEDEKPIEIEIK